MNSTLSAKALNSASWDESVNEPLSNPRTSEDIAANRLELCIQKVRHLMPYEHRIHVTMKKTSWGEHEVSLKTRFHGQEIVYTANNHDEFSAITQAVFGLKQKLIKEKRKRQDRFRAKRFILK